MGTNSDRSQKWAAHLAAGVGSGALSSIVCAPLDVLRTRLQVQEGGKGSPLQRASFLLREMGRHEGYRGFFRGLGATLVTVPAFWGVYFPLYDESKAYLKSHFEWSEVYVHSASAVFSGCVADVVCNPAFVVRTRLQTQALHTSGRQPGFFETARSLYQQNGIPTFYRGMTANIMGLSHVAVQFPAYEALKRELSKYSPHNEPLTAGALVVASGLSKMIASLLTYPHEVIRSRMMDNRKQRSVSLVDTCASIYKTSGWVGFYAGLPVSLIRVIPNTCITFVTYELFLQYYEQRKKRGT